MKSRKFDADDFKPSRDINQGTIAELDQHVNVDVTAGTIARCSWGSELTVASSNGTLTDERIVKLMVALENAKIGDKQIDQELLFDFLHKIGVTKSEFNRGLQFLHIYQNGACSQLTRESIHAITESFNRIVHYGSAMPITLRQNPVNNGERLRDDFEILGEIGKGGFGVVYKVKHRIDGGLYAIKEVVVHDTHQEEIDRVTREVEVATQFTHENIVRYHTCWQSYDIQPIVPVNRRLTESEPYITEVSETNDDDEWEGDQSWSSDSGSDNEHSSQLFNAYDRSYNDESSNQRSLDRALVPVTKKHDIEPDEPHHHQRNTIIIYKLFIQMSLCEQSLRDYMELRNAKPVTTLASEFNVASDLTRGIAYLHERHYIHRDIKPENLLYNAQQDKWQICDFGLARINPRHRETVPSLAVMASTAFHLSSGIGTAHYSAPEQMHSNDYTFAVDLFALGYVLFELFCPMSGLSERVRVFGDIRTTQPETLPDLFHHSPMVTLLEPEEAASLTRLITDCIQSDPIKRPNAVDVTRHLNNIIHADNGMADKDAIIKQLLRRLKKQECELKRLRPLLANGTNTT